MQEYKRSSVAALYLWFLMNSQNLEDIHVYAGAVVCVAYMVLDGIKYMRKGSK